MSIPPPDWLYEDRTTIRRRRRRRITLVTLVAVVAGGGWVASASPWAPEVQRALAEQPAYQRVVALQNDLGRSPVGRFFAKLSAIGDSGERLAHLAPAETTFYAELAPSWWTRLWTWGPSMRPQGPALEEARRLARESFDMDWDTDLAPWIEPDVGVLGLANGGWSFWAASRDGAAADAFLAKLRDRRVAAGETAEARRHGDTDYTVLTPANGTAYAVGRLGDHVVMAAPVASMDTFIDRRVNGGPTLADDHPRFRRVMNEVAPGAVGRAWIDWGGRRVDPLLDESPTAPKAEATGAAIEGDGESLTWRVATAFDTTDVPPESLERYRRLLPALDMACFDRLPDSTVMAVGGTATPDTARWLAAPVGWLWAPLGGGVGPGWAFSTLLAHLDEARGPFAAGLVAADPDAEAADPVGAVVSLRPEHPEALDAALMTEGGRLTNATDLSRLGGPLTSWLQVPWLNRMLPKATELVEEPHGRQTWHVLKAVGAPLAGWTSDGRAVVLAGGGEAIRLSQPEGFRSLSARTAFQIVRRRLPGTPGFYAYADGPNLARLFEASPLLPARYAHQAGRSLKGLTAVGAAFEPGLDARGFHHAALTVLAKK